MNRKQLSLLIVLGAVLGRWRMARRLRKSADEFEVES